MVTDHDVLYMSERAVARGAFNRAAARAWGITNFYDAGQGGHGSEGLPARIVARIDHRQHLPFRRVEVQGHVRIHDGDQPGHHPEMGHLLGDLAPLIGAAGISAFPMAGRLAARLAQDEDFDNFILMHAMGANTAGQLGSVAAGGVLLALVSGVLF